MAKAGFKVMDSDMHIVEPVDLWEKGYPLNAGQFGVGRVR